MSVKTHPKYTVRNCQSLQVLGRYEDEYEAVSDAIRFSADIAGDQPVVVYHETLGSGVFGVGDMSRAHPSYGGMARDNPNE